MEELTRLIREDMKPALGVTEPGAIAFAVASAKKYTKGEIIRVKVALNSGMYKNALSGRRMTKRQPGWWRLAGSMWLWIMWDQRSPLTLR